MDPKQNTNLETLFNQFHHQDDPYMKWVSPEAASRKTGLNILVYADLNIAGQLTGICRALNAFTPHKARCVIVRDDYLQYDHDIVLFDREGKQIVSDLTEMIQLVKKADIIHVGRQAVNLPGLDFDRILNENNSLVQYFGTDLRLNHERLFLWHMKKNIAALVGYGWVLAYPLPRRFYHIEQFFDPTPFARVPKLKPGDPVRVVHAPTDRTVKGTDFFLEIMERLKKNFNVAVDIIEKVPNAVCLERKSKGHITFDEIGTPTFGQNTRESMAMGHACLSSVNPHVLSYLPDLPVVRITPETLEPLLRRLLSDVNLINRIGDMSYEFVRKTYNPKLNAVKLGHLYEGIKFGFFHTSPGLPPGLSEKGEPFGNDLVQ